MFRSRIAFLAIAAMSIVASAVAAPFVAAYRYITGHVEKACLMAAQSPDKKQGKPSWVEKAGAFAASLAKRERPLLSGSWRMCPSA
ncbi:hypothetical protein [Delftia sp. UGAL515B_04]|uniref:hypothetical protein n=1 Tax=Delftia sp. UGAL515B_04 TaxID=2986766 RepID=UPI0029531CF6|nr:hypothetical protein [Delftia sp. UGAL515B_04]WON88671.1 hypothetical protein OK021_28770 [Delftia sp. UGAL515B_04]